jgi:hypothetical protein
MAARPARDPVAPEDRPTDRRKVGLAIGAVVLVALVALFVWRAGGDDTALVAPSPEPTATAPPTEEPTAPETDPDDAAAPDTGDADPGADAPGDDSTADGEAAAPGFPAGEASFDDPAGDLGDPDGNPPPTPAPAADLVRVEVASDGSELDVTLQFAGDVPEQSFSHVWALHLFDQARERTYSVTVQQQGTELFHGVLDWDTGEQVSLPDDPQVSGAELTFTVPADLLPKVDGPFLVAASTQYDETFEDHAPDLRRSAPQPVPFPG